MEEKRYSILLADDEPIERMALVKRLKKYFEENCQIYQAENGKEALDVFRQKQCQVVIMDIAMPEMNGVEAAERIRALDSECSIIFLSAYDDFAYARKAIQIRALDYLLKPCENEDLVAVIEEAIHQAQRRAREVKRQDAVQMVSPEAGGAEEQAETAEREGLEVPAGHLTAGETVRDQQMESVRAAAREHAAVERMAQAAEKIRDYLQKNYMKEISMQEAARMMEYSDAYFCKLFKQCFGQNFTTYLTILRVNEAKKLLRDPLANIREVSMKVGYYDSNYFAKVFKRYTGMIPSDYRDSQSTQNK